MTKLYRLIHKDGTHSAWTTDFEEAKRSATILRARIETRIVEKKNK